jgi:hypothetical protein
MVIFLLPVALAGEIYKGEVDLGSVLVTFI